MKKTLATLWLFSVVAVAIAHPHGSGFIERKKTILKSFETKPTEALHIDNRYGDVKVQLWEKSSIRIDITITANAPTEEKAAEAVNSIQIEEKRNSNGITLQTIFGGGERFSIWRSRKGENSIRVDYLVQMPKQNPLTVKNTYGDTDIAQFRASLAVESHYGNFRAQNLSSNNNNITVTYGNATIDQMDVGKLASQYSKINLNKVKDLVVVNKFGQLNIGQVASLKADIDYAGAKIGSVTEAAVVKLNYSDEFCISESTAQNVDIKAAYSSVVVPAVQPARFDVSVTYGNFTYPSKVPVSFTNKSGNYKTKLYEGNIGGDNPANTIKIISVYGNVKLKD
ncbi:hypothetical protein GCM10023091_40210 [Ravibacter arvi]|uniref:DUF4097 domain-containing protein n=1 Tax=Ravibacter arvi TaxID=2051041 RepID=A0ABP8MC51_9BACT